LINTTAFKAFCVLLGASQPRGLRLSWLDVIIAHDLRTGTSVKLYCNLNKKYSVILRLRGPGSGAGVVAYADAAGEAGWWARGAVRRGWAVEGRERETGWCGRRGKLAADGGGGGIGGGMRCF